MKLTSLTIFFRPFAYGLLLFTFLISLSSCEENSDSKVSEPLNGSVLEEEKQEDDIITEDFDLQEDVDLQGEAAAKRIQQMYSVAFFYNNQLLSGEHTVHLIGKGIDQFLHSGSFLLDNIEDLEKVEVYYDEKTFLIKDVLFESGKVVRVDLKDEDIITDNKNVPRLFKLKFNIENNFDVINVFQKVGDVYTIFARNMVLDLNNSLNITFEDSEISEFLIHLGNMQGQNKYARFSVEDSTGFETVLSPENLKNPGDENISLPNFYYDGPLEAGMKGFSLIFKGSSDSVKEGLVEYGDTVVPLNIGASLQGDIFFNIAVPQEEKMVNIYLRLQNAFYSLSDISYKNSLEEVSLTQAEKISEKLYNQFLEKSLTIASKQFFSRNDLEYLRLNLKGLNSGDKMKIWKKQKALGAQLRENNGVIEFTYEENVLLGAAVLKQDDIIQYLVQTDSSNYLFDIDLTALGVDRIVELDVTKAQDLSKEEVSSFLNLRNIKFEGLGEKKVSLHVYLDDKIIFNLGRPRIYNSNEGIPVSLEEPITEEVDIVLFIEEKEAYFFPSMILSDENTTLSLGAAEKKDGDYRFENLPIR